MNDKAQEILDFLRKYGGYRREPVDKGQGTLDFLTKRYTAQSNNGLDPEYRRRLLSGITGRIDERFREAGKTNTENLASAGLTASGLGSIANIKLAGERERAMSNAETNIAGMDQQVMQNALRNLLGVQQGQLGIANSDERTRQFNEQLAFQKDQANDWFGQLMGAITGGATQVGTAYMLRG